MQNSPDQPLERQSSQSRQRFWQLVLGIGMLLAVLAILHTEQQTEVLLKIRFRYKWLFAMGLFAAVFIAQAWLWFRPTVLAQLTGALERFSRRADIARLLGAILLLGGLLLIWVARFSPLGKLDPILGVTLLAVWFIVLVQALGISWLSGLTWEPALIAALLVDGVVFQVYAIFQPVTAYPFSLGWSEASRYYYGSLPFSQSIYGQSLPLSFLHGSRYLMLSIPFLMRGLPLWADRLWQSLLWLGVTGLTAWLATRRIPAAPRWLRWVLGAWFFLFFFQGVVYYHLQVCIILVLLGVWPKHPWRSLLAVLAASLWAGMSRLNWFPVPAMLAIAIYLLEVPLARGKDLWRYLARPALWAVCGIGAALVGQAFYIWVSRSPDLSAFGSSFTSDLLWYRLLPNPTYAPGVILGILLVSLPAAIFLYDWLRGRLSQLHPIRLLGLGAMLLVLFAGGLVVSTKIGGGGDLHNMDAFLVLLAMIVLYVAGRAVALDRAGETPLQAPAWPILLLLVIVPVGLSFLKVSKPFRYDAEQAAQDLATLAHTTQAYSREGEVLFMYERHLQTFHMVSEMPVVPDYEVVTLMEMAISGNQPYLSNFYHDLETHRFGAIVMRKSNLAVNAGDFLEENNAWNRLVAYPVECEYQPVLPLESSNIAVYVPREQRECPALTEGETQP